ncbi:MAG: methylmalonyl-CoA epimerase [Thermoplasmata archaeon]|jgi:methylmalonyl-CoA epimerase
MEMKVDHLGIAVRSLPEAIERWRPIVKEDVSAPEEVPSQRVRVVFANVGGTHLELLEPTSPDSPIAHFLESRGEGFHHVAFHVDSVDAELERLVSSGLRVVDAHGRSGARGRRVGFAHPSAFGGVLVEFVEGP